MTDPAVIARSLNEAQRRMLFATSGKRFKSLSAIIRHAKIGWRKIGYFSEFVERTPYPSPPKYRLSVYGLAVRAELERERNG